MFKVVPCHLGGLNQTAQSRVRDPPSGPSYLPSVSSLHQGSVRLCPLDKHSTDHVPDKPKEGAQVALVMGL